MAGEPESLDTDEPLARRIERHDYDRLLMLSDGVFAIAITLLALELRPPDHWDGGYGALLSETSRALLGYLIGFVIVGAFWLVHRRIFARIRRVDAVITWLNLLLLCVVAIAPVVAKLMAAAGPVKALPIYAGMIVVISLVQSAMWARASFVSGLAHPAITAPERLRLLVRLLLPGLIFGAMIAALAAGIDVIRPQVLVLAAAAMVVSRRLLERKAGVRT